MMDKSAKLKIEIVTLIIISIIIIGLLLPTLLTVFISEESKLIGAWGGKEARDKEIWIFHDEGYFEIVNLTNGNQIQSIGNWEIRPNNELYLYYITPDKYHTTYNYIINEWGGGSLELKSGNINLNFYKISN